MEESTNKWLYRFQWIAVGIALVVILFYASSSQGADNKSIQTPKEWKPYVRSDKIDEWPTQIIYDTMIGCYEGTLRWVLLSNPQLTGIPPGIMAQRQMLEHCFCVMDRIRREISIEEYQKRVFEQEWVGNIFITKAFECVKEEKTLPSFFVIQGDKEIEVVPNNPVVVPDGETDDSQEESPDQKQEESEGSPQTIFQG